MDVRLYIRDDGSSDRTTDILASYQEHKNVKIEKGNNLGFAKSFLTALDECDEADYYAFSDQDDVWEKDKLSTAIEILEEESQSTPLLYCSALQRVDENLNPLHVQSYHGLRINLPSMLTRGRLAGCTFVFNNTLRNLVKNSSQIEMHARKMVGFTLVNLKIRKHIKPIVFIAGIIFMSTIYNKIDITMLSALSTDEAVGYYSYAQRTVNIVLTMCSAVTAIFLPRLSYYYDNEKAVFYKLMDKGFQILCLGVVPLAVGLFLTANQAVVLLYGDSFTPTGTTIKLMCPLILIKGFGDLLCYQLAYSSKNEYILLPGSAIASIINVITNSILIPLYAQNGAVIASVMSELTTNIIQFLYLKRKIKYHISNTALVLSLFSTMVMAAVVCAIIKMNLPLAVALAMEISIGGAIYLLMNIALKNRILSEMLTKVLKKHNTGFQDS